MLFRSPCSNTSIGNSPASDGMAIKSGFGGGTGSVDLLVQQVPVSTVRRTVLYLPISKTFVLVVTAEASAEDIFPYDCLKLLKLLL